MIYSKLSKCNKNQIDHARQKKVTKLGLTKHLPPEQRDKQQVTKTTDTDVTPANYHRVCSDAQATFF